MVLWHGYGYDTALGYIALTRFDGERNFPTLFSTLQLALAAGILYFIGHYTSTQRFYWFALAAVFLFLTADEFTGFHERLALMRAAANPGMTPQYAWLLPYLFGVAVVALFFVRFLLAIPRRTAILMCVAGALFVSAAVGLEAVTGYVDDLGYPVDDIRQRLVATLEELVEMSSISLFIYALLDFLRNQAMSVNIKVR